MLIINTIFIVYLVVVCFVYFKTWSIINNNMSSLIEVGRKSNINITKSKLDSAVIIVSILWPFILIGVILSALFGETK